jgi:hypothetical protein
LKQIGEIFQTDYLQELGRAPLDAERDWHQWLDDHNHDPDAIEVLAHYASALFRVGVDLSNFDLIDTITGHLWYLEDAILITLSKKDLDDPTAYLIKALRSQWKIWKHRSVRTEPRLQVYTAADWQPESSPPPPGYFESVKQMLQSKRPK